MHTKKKASRRRSGGTSSESDPMQLGKSDGAKKQSATPCAISESKPCLFNTHDMSKRVGEESPLSRQPVITAVQLVIYAVQRRVCVFEHKTTAALDTGCKSHLLFCYRFQCLGLGLSNRLLATSTRQ